MIVRSAAPADTPAPGKTLIRKPPVPPGALDGPRATIRSPMQVPPAADRVRLDKWLWAARIFKTRALAAEEVAAGRVAVNDQGAKPGRELRIGDRVAVRQGALTRTWFVRMLSQVRGPAAAAQALYEETPESVAAREAHAAQRKLGTEPALALEQGRPTKRDRRKLADWQRWSATSDDVE